MKNYHFNASIDIFHANINFNNALINFRTLQRIFINASLILIMAVKLGI